MLLIAILYLAVGLYMQCALFSLNPDWTDAETWRHLLLWPGYAWPTLPGGLRHVGLPGVPSVHWLYVALIALFLLPLPGIWLAARRLRAHGRRRVQAGRVTQAAAPADARSRMEPRFGT